MYLYMCIYVYYQFRRGRAFHTLKKTMFGPVDPPHTVGFHNFNLRIFNVRVSNPSKLIVDVCFDTMSDFNVPGSRPKKHDEISEIDHHKPPIIQIEHFGQQ